MAITQRARLARALRDTTAERHWRREASEGVVVGLATYYGLRSAYSPHEAMPHVVALGIALAVGLVAIPVLEFAWNYARAPLAIELDELRAAQTGSTLSPAAPVVPRPYVREASGGEVLTRLGAVRWNEREAVIRASYSGRWLRGRAYVVAISPISDSTLVCLADEPGNKFWGYLKVANRGGAVVEHLQPGDWIDYDGQIGNISLITVELINSTVNLAA